MTNKDVITAWGQGRPARSANLSTDGNRLYSYALCIGEYRDGLPVVFNYTARDDMNPFGHRVPSLGFYSMTTSHHVSLARRVGYAFEKGDRGYRRGCPNCGSVCGVADCAVCEAGKPCSRCESYLGVWRTHKHRKGGDAWSYQHGPDSHEHDPKTGRVSTVMDKPSATQSVAPSAPQGGQS